VTVLSVGMRTVLVVLMLSLVPSLALADGKFYDGRDHVAPGIPFQRAAIFFDGQRETLVVQSSYERGLHGGEGDLAWVVPVPAMPEVRALEAKDAYGMFRILNLLTQPRVVWISPIVCVVLFLVSVGLVVLVLLQFLFTIKVPRVLGGRAAALPRLLLAAFLLFLSMMGVLGVSGEGMRAIDMGSIGVYDVTVIEGGTGEEIAGWLSGNGFGYGEEDAETFAFYAERGWCFVAAKVSAGAENRAFYHDTLAAPLVLSFDTKKAVYPMLLTALQGEATELSLFVMAPHCVRAEGAPDRTFAGSGTIEDLLEGNFPLEKLPVKKDAEVWVTHFRATVPVERTTADLVFEFAEEDEEFRPTHYRW